MRGVAIVYANGKEADTMPKFFVDSDEIQGNRIFLKGKNADHLKVLRPKEGEAFTASDGSGTDYACRYASGALEILSAAPSDSEPSVWVSVFAALPKGDKTDTIIQKSVELGVGEIFFFASSRCVAKQDTLGAKKKAERWNRIAEEAAMQSGRGRIPKVDWLASFSDMATEAAKSELACFLWEGEHTLSLKKALCSRAGALRRIALVTGPEGGFSKEEAASAASAGLYPVTVGRRILRCETAPLCALTAVMYETDNLG